MFVVDVEPGLIELQADAACDPRNESFMMLGFSPVPPEVRWLAVGERLRAHVWTNDCGDYVRLTDDAGVLRWEGGDLDSAPADALLRVGPQPAGPTCARDDVPELDDCCCSRLTPLQVLFVTASGGTLDLPVDVPVSVDIGGRPYVAVAQESVEFVGGPCTLGGTGRYTHAYVTPLADPDLEPPDPPELPGPGLASCPADPPSEEWAPCETDPELDCTYDIGGCQAMVRCRGCFWHLVTTDPPCRLTPP